MGLTSPLQGFFYCELHNLGLTPQVILYRSFRAEEQ